MKGSGCMHSKETSRSHDAWTESRDRRKDSSNGVASIADDFAIKATQSTANFGYAVMVFLFG